MNRAHTPNGRSYAMRPRGRNRASRRPAWSRPHRAAGRRRRRRGPPPGCGDGPRRGQLPGRSRDHVRRRRRSRTSAAPASTRIAAGQHAGAGDDPVAARVRRVAARGQHLGVDVARARRRDRGWRPPRPVRRRASGSARPGPASLGASTESGAGVAASATAVGGRASASTGRRRRRRRGRHGAASAVGVGHGGRARRRRGRRRRASAWAGSTSEARARDARRARRHLHHRRTAPSASPRRSVPSRCSRSGTTGAGLPVNTARVAVGLVLLDSPAVAADRHARRDRGTDLGRGSGSGRRRRATSPRGTAASSSPTTRACARPSSGRRTRRSTAAAASVPAGRCCHCWPPRPSWACAAPAPSARTRAARPRRARHPPSGRLEAEVGDRDERCAA